MPPDRLLEILDEAISSRVVEDFSNTLERYQFSHVLIRETLYGELSAPRRARLHRRVGEILEEIYSADLGPYFAQLSHHFVQSLQIGRAEKAVEYSIKPAERDMAMLAYEEAADTTIPRFRLCIQFPSPMM